MSTAAYRVARLLATTAMIAVPVGMAASAGAVSPPPIDPSALPAAATPVPPQRTEQSGECVATAARTTESGRPESVGLQAVWQLTRGAGQTIAVIDTGVARHRLLPRLIPGGDYVSAGDGTADCDGHGTIVAGIIGSAPESDDPSAFSGIAPEATIIGIRQSSNKFRAAGDPAGAGVGDVETLAKAVRSATDMGATVINVSSVACLPAPGGLDDRALGAALSYAVDVKNVVVVTAAGNVGGPGQCPDQNPVTDPSQPGRPDWAAVTVVVSPAWYDEYVLTVGSVDRDGAPSRFSLAGPWVDIAARGEDMLSLDPDGEGLVDRLTRDSGDAPISGTSYAAPVVAGVAALIRARSPELSARQVMQRIEETAHHPAEGWNPVVGHGLVDALAAVSSGPSPTPDHDRSIPSVSTLGPRPPDRRADAVALRGAAICLALAAALAAMTVSATRLRRRSDAAPHE